MGRVKTGIIPGAVRSKRMKSALFPSSRDPVVSPSPTARAPSIVAILRTSQAGMTSGSENLILLKSAVACISLNMLWLLLPGAWSEPRATSPPASRKTFAGGTIPSMIPMEFEQRAMEAPLRATVRASSSVASVRWTAIRDSSRNPCSASQGTGRLP